MRFVSFLPVHANNAKKIKLGLGLGLGERSRENYPNA